MSSVVKVNFEVQAKEEDILGLSKSVDDIINHVQQHIDNAKSPYEKSNLEDLNDMLVDIKIDLDEMKEEQDGRE
mgnify:CR=1 FL=1|jgi:hypothetical protein|tara:strand:- start:427 stop:648 length:222 start_codon:yes stop_codon:yes gene_type:complete